MKKYSMTCTCGHKMDVDANSLDEAKIKMKEMMSQEATDAHWVEKHKDDTGPKPTLEQVHMQIDQMLAEEIPAPAPAM